MMSKLLHENESYIYSKIKRTLCNSFNGNFIQFRCRKFWFAIEKCQLRIEKQCEVRFSANIRNVKILIFPVIIQCFNFFKISV